jgi:hypothetical protein
MQRGPTLREMTAELYSLRLGAGGDVEGVVLSKSRDSLGTLGENDLPLSCKSRLVVLRERFGGGDYF